MNIFDQLEQHQSSAPPPPPLNQPETWGGSPTQQVAPVRPKKHRPKLPSLQVPFAIRKALTELCCALGVATAINTFLPEAASVLSLLNSALLIGALYLAFRARQQDTGWLVLAAFSLLILKSWGLG